MEVPAEAPRKGKTSQVQDLQKKNPQTSRTLLKALLQLRGKKGMGCWNLGKTLWRLLWERTCALTLSPNPLGLSESLFCVPWSWGMWWVWFWLMLKEATEAGGSPGGEVGSWPYKGRSEVGDDGVVLIGGQQGCLQKMWVKNHLLKTSVRLRECKANLWQYQTVENFPIPLAFLLHPHMILGGSRK